MSQNVYYDALQLTKSIKQNPGDKKKVFFIFDQNDALDSVVLKNIVGILKRYYPELENLSAKDFATKLSSDTSRYYNPFIKDLLIQIKQLPSSAINASGKL